jgi:arsenite methyltransferase
MSRQSKSRMGTRCVMLCLTLLLVGGCSALKRCAYEGIGRDDWQSPDQVIELLDIELGDRVADLGAGGGYFTFRLADAVGPAGRVYAVDVDPDMVEYLGDRSVEDDYPQVVATLASDDDPNLPESGVDLVFTSNTYHHIDDRIGYFQRLRPFLRPGARVAIIEYRDSSFPAGHDTESEVILEEMKAAGYRLLDNHEFLKKQSFLVFAAATK